MPTKNASETPTDEPSLYASGIRCKNASPKSVPAANATAQMRNFLILSSPNGKNAKPNKERRLTIKTEIMV